MAIQAQTELPLAGQLFQLNPGGHVAGAYANELLHSLGAETPTRATGDGIDTAIDWAESGLMYLCGEADQPPRQGPGAIPSCARGTLQALRALAPQFPAGLDAARLLTERAAILGLRRHGSISPNQSCRLLAVSDGWIALNLARQDDWHLLPAWLESADVLEDWPALERAIRSRSAAVLVERGRLLGLPVAAAQAHSAGPQSWCRVHTRGLEKPRPAEDKRPLVVDLSSLWAGPLCSHLLQLCGARVIKVESRQRLDGARQGARAFYDLLNADKESVVLDLTAEAGRRQLRGLLSKADIVVEGSRARALRQLGIDAEQLVREVPGLSWLAISGYGRGEPQANWVAFGDDAAVAAGIAAATADPPMFCGDALADPLTGMHAALAGLAFWRSGGGVLLDLSLCDVAAHCLRFAAPVPIAPLRQEQGEWKMRLQGCAHTVDQPEPRLAAGKAAPPGRDTLAVITEFALSC